MAAAGTGLNRYVVALTGARGILYTRKLCGYFQTRPDLEVHAVCSAAGEQVLKLELGLRLEELVEPRTILHAADDFAAPLASGSFRVRAMVVIPCSMGTLGAIAQGQSRNLIHRAAIVLADIDVGPDDQVFAHQSGDGAGLQDVEAASVHAPLDIQGVATLAGLARETGFII